MIKDITFGQYYNAKSLIHNLDPRTKIISVIVYLIVMFTAQSYFSYFLCFLFLFIIICLSKVPIRFMLKGFRSILFLIFLSVFFNLFLTPGKKIFEIGFLSITYEGLILASKMAMRLIFLVLFSSLLTLTTTPKKLTDGIEKLLSFLKMFKIPVQDIALMMSISLRFIPVLLTEVNIVMDAQISRGARFDDKNIIKRAKSYVPLLVPIFVSAFRRADDLSLAMESRCYSDNENRTKLYPLKYKRTDYVAFLILLIYMLSVIIVRNKFI